MKNEKSKMSMLNKIEQAFYYLLALSIFAVALYFLFKEGILEALINVGG